jgi:hypothetical protein
VTPDVVIALCGGPGTLCELAWANQTGKRVLFVESAAYLKYELGQKIIAEKVRCGIQQALDEFPAYRSQSQTASDVVAALKRRLRRASDETLSARKIVEKAILGLHHSYETGFPGIRSVDHSKSHFESWLRGFPMIAQ